MSVEADLSIWGLITQASFLVQMVMFGLLMASLASWVVIFNKRRLMRQTYGETEWFEDRFWSGGNLNDIYNEVMQRGDVHIHNVRHMHNSVCRCSLGHGFSRLLLPIWFGSPDQHHNHEMQLCQKPACRCSMEPCVS